MSEFSSVAPPPPPPPSAPAAPAGFDFVKPFTFIFQDPRWLTKILIGGLFQIASIFLIGIFFTLGYCARLARNVIGGVEPPAPEWDDLGDNFADGLRLFGVVIVYALPLIAVACALVIPIVAAGVLSGASDTAGDLAAHFAGGFSMLIGLLMFPVGLAYSIWLPGALLMTAVERKFSAGFEFGRIWSLISNNLANYLLAFVVLLIARFGTSLGLILFCIGVFFTAFWAMTIGTYAFAQAYRLSRQR